MSTQSEPTITPKKKRVHAGGVAKGYKQSPEHVATLKAKRDKIMRAKKKLGLAWKDPLPDGHPLKATYDKTRAAKYRANKKAARESALGVAQGPAKATKDTPDAKLTPEQLKKRKDNAEYRARKKAEGVLYPSDSKEKKRERNQRWYAKKKKVELAGLPVPVKAKAKRNGHNGDEVIHDLLPMGKGTISVAQVMGRMGQVPPVMAAGSREDRVLGLVEMWTQLVREVLAKE